mmetsp:Transcript_62761/g.99446  ORF Transcript_62761/g.99446 Transcript_62761/m.99446 type:complete len:249 (-) Transcript_62761:618-1364(-)
MCLIGAATNLQKLGIAPKSLHVVFTHVAIATHDLDGPVGHIFAHLTTVELHAVCIQTIAYRVQLQMSCHVVDIAASRLVLCVGLRDEALDLSKAIEVGPKGLSLSGVPVHFLDASSGDAQTHGCQDHSFDLQISHHAQGGLSLFADQIRRRHPAVLEDQLSGHRGAHATCVLNLLAQREPLGALFNQEERHVPATLARACVDQVGIARLLAVHGAVGNPHLGTVQHVLITLSLRGGLHPQHVRAHARL